MEYIQAIDYINALPTGEGQALARTSRLLSCLGNPQWQYRSIHVAGTNGKGSTCAFLHSILQTAGYRTGLYISPHLERLEERMQIDTPIPAEEFGQVAGEVRRVMEENQLPSPGYFGFLTCMAFLWFAHRGVQVAVVETGLGGRLDPTNVLRPECCLITAIGLEHQAQLGTDLTAIAAEKCGIIQPDGIVVSQAQTEVVARVIDLVCKERRCGLISLANAHLKLYPCENGEKFDLGLGMWCWHGLEIGLKGIHQVQNAASAAWSAYLMNQSGLTVTEQHVRDGLKKAQWPARLEQFSYRGRRVVLDGAHNPMAVETLRKAFVRHYPKEQPVLLCSVMQDKDVKNVARQFERFVGPVVVCTYAEPGRSMKVRELSTYFKKRKHVCLIDVQKALDKACELAGEDGLVLVSGSLYLCGEIRRLLEKQE